MTSVKNKKVWRISASEKALIGEVEKKINFIFKDKKLILRALTHRSLVKEDNNLGLNDQNERLEFLGDAVLGLVAAQEIFIHLPYSNEGMLSQLRAMYVCMANLAEAGRKLSLGNYVRVAKAMRNSGPVDLPSVLSDVMEALFGAAFLDQGLDAAKELILYTLGPVPLKLKEQPKDAKTTLQEHFQSLSTALPVYKITEVKGSLHEPLFTVQVVYEGQIIATAKGSSKKEATQNAAEVALIKIDSSRLR